MQTVISINLICSIIVFSMSGYYTAQSVKFTILYQNTIYGRSLLKSIILLICVGIMNSIIYFGNYRGHINFSNIMLVNVMIWLFTFTVKICLSMDKFRRVTRYKRTVDVCNILTLILVLVSGFYMVTTMYNLLYLNISM